ncbi:DUF2291 family protein [Salinisphaera sp. Q1T1-3]|uniref:DUF2291 family protein n=1 Tax=Salinisphaera sp. Q1T1-3 TaxID=2321229 RepID=UPI000E7601AD|nr:DUF2291 domain-containing protein [Salinisphaera sp. Q1T1-3]RJS93502.1 DUF2291 domain-containing protein [Salinisphaera sp. Q1T1-3]
MSSTTKTGIWVGVVVVLLVAMGLDTKVVPDGADIGAGAEQFSPEQYGKSEFPRIQGKISGRAAPAAELVSALSDDKDAATEKYGVAGAIGPVLSVKFQGQVASCDSGICTVDVPDVPDSQTIRVQVGPAINGTALRDGVGDISFGDFKNQIEYQNAASGINNAMKQEVLADVNRDALEGKTVDVTGVFQLIIDNNWLVTPVKFSVSS